MKIFIVLCFYVFTLFEVIQLEIVRYWGERCFMDNDCTDHRQSCAEHPETGSRKCECDNFHTWDESLRFCKPRYNTTYMLTFLQEKFNTAGWIEKEAIFIFNGAMYAGSIVVLIAILSFICVILYCNHVRKSDTRLKVNVKTLNEENDKKKSKSIRPGPKDTKNTVLEI